MKTVADLAQQVNFEWWTKVKPPSSLNVYSNMSETIKWFFDHPLLKELRKALLTLTGMVSGDGKAAVQLNYLNAVDAMKSAWDTERSKPQYSDYKDKDSKWLGEQIKKYPFSLKDDPTDDVTTKSPDAPWSEKHFFASVLTPEEQIAYILNPTERKKYQDWENDQKINLTGFMKNDGAVQILDKSEASNGEKPDADKAKAETSSQWQELTSWQSYDALKLNPSVPWLTGKVELSQDQKILTVDGQVVALKESEDKKTSSGLLHVSNKENTWFVEHMLTVDVASGKVSLIEWTQSISLDANNTVIKTVYENWKLKLPIAAWQEKLFNYFAFSRSVDNKSPNTIDPVYNALATDSTAMNNFQTKFVKLQADFALLAVKNWTTIANLIDKSWLKDIKLDDTKKQWALATTLNNWKAMFITEEPKTVAKASVAPTKKV